MPLPNGWLRRSSGRIFNDGATTVTVEFINGDFSIIADAEGVLVGAGDDLLLIETTADRDGLIAILDRAWRQHAYIEARCESRQKGIDDGEPDILPPDQEQIQVTTQMAWYRCTGCHDRWQLPGDLQVMHSCANVNGKLIRIDPKTGMEIV